MYFKFSAFSSCFFLCILLFSKNPPKKKLWEGSPDNTNEVVIDEAPGTCVILIEFFIHSFTNLYPGSDMSGVPASLTNPNFWNK